MEDATSRQAPKLTWIAVGLGTALCALFATVGADARWLAALGHEIVERGGIPAGIPFAAAPSRGWDNVPVLGELVFHALDALGGDRGLITAQLVAAAAALALVARDMRAAGAADAPRALVLLALPFAAAPAFIVVRSQLFSLALFPLLLLLLRSEARTPSRRIWLLVPLVALWTNLHGGVLVGLAVAGAYLVLHRLRREPAVAIGVLAVSASALFATPALLHTSDYYLGVLHSEAAARGEGMWAPLSLHSPFDVAFLVLGIPLLVAALRSRLALWELAALAALAASALDASRNEVWFVLFAAGPAALALTHLRLARLTASPRTALACACVPAAILVLGVAQAPAQSGAGARLREEAAAAARGTPILADAIDAERLALDGKTIWISNPLDAFGRRQQRLYLDWLAGRPSGDRVLAQTHRVVLVAVGSPAQRRLARDRAFYEVARDRESVLYLRASSR